jgi:hypothetical protein
LQPETVADLRNETMSALIIPSTWRSKVTEAASTPKEAAETHGPVPDQAGLESAAGQIIGK